MHGILVETEKELVGQERERKKTHMLMPRKTLPRTHIVQAFGKQRDLLSYTVAFCCCCWAPSNKIRAAQEQNNITLHYSSHMTKKAKQLENNNN